MIRKESRAWRWLAERVAEKKMEGALHNIYLCHEIQKVGSESSFEEAKLSPEVEAAMLQRIAVALGVKEEEEVHYTSAYPEMLSDYNSNNGGRVLACLMFAEQAEEEGK
jgi:hypothetical protein